MKLAHYAKRSHHNGNMYIHDMVAKCFVATPWATERNDITGQRKKASILQKRYQMLFTWPPLGSNQGIKLILRTCF